MNENELSEPAATCDAFNCIYYHIAWILSADLGPNVLYKPQQKLKDNQKALNKARIDT